jgi:LPS export ABC transporter protein LptC
VIWYRRLPVDSETDEPAGLPSANTRAEMVTRDFRHVETRMDRTVWILEAERAEIFEESARLHGVKITWYGEDGTVPVLVTSREGRVNLRSRNASLTGKVRLERADGSVLETERLSWDDEKKLLRAPQEVLITTSSFTFRGTSLIANIAEKWVKLGGRVQGEIRGVASATRSS